MAMPDKGWLGDRFDTALSATTPLTNITNNYTPPAIDAPQP